MPHSLPLCLTQAQLQLTLINDQSLHSPLSSLNLKTPITLSSSLSKPQTKSTKISKSEGFFFLFLLSFLVSPSPSKLSSLLSTSRLHQVIFFSFDFDFDFDSASRFHQLCSLLFIYLFIFIIIFLDFSLDSPFMLKMKKMRMRMMIMMLFSRFVSHFSVYASNLLYE